jgi:hemerythrin-like domain-containing protein
MAPSLLKGSVMDPLDILTTEHREVERVLDAFERFATSPGATAAAWRDDLARFVHVLRAVIHDAHQAREEQVLFVQLVTRGFPNEAGPIAALRAEHRESTSRLAALARAAAPGEGGDPRARVADQIHDYARHLRRHFATEEGCLFPAARAYLSDAAATVVAVRLGHGPAPQAGTLERLHALVDRYH